MSPWLALSVTFSNIQPTTAVKPNTAFLSAVTGLALLQVFAGGIVSGMKAGLSYPTWPLMLREFFPSALLKEKFSWNAFMQYNAADYWGRTFIQFTHRTIAYSLLLVTIAWNIYEIKKHSWRNLPISVKTFNLSLLLQIAIGIITVLSCVGRIPVFWGVAHQAGAMIVLANLSWIWFDAKRKQSFAPRDYVHDVVSAATKYA
ncbi:MAG: COX15/CtaA family protein [Chitinophagales bacterium]|nr:COX15/CtaA family protein [Chitinophagales bacterium]